MRDPRILGRRTKLSRIYGQILSTKYQVLKQGASPTWAASPQYQELRILKSKLALQRFGAQRHKKDGLRKQAVKV
jgi:hypothetical protein